MQKQQFGPQFNQMWIFNINIGNGAKSLFAGPAKDYGEESGFGQLSIAKVSNVLVGKSLRTKREFQNSCDEIDPPV